MNTYYRNDLDKALMIIEGEEKLDVDYQTFMLQENVIAGFLSTNIRYIDDKGCYQYDISGKTSLQSRHQKAKLTRHEITKIIRAILSAVKEVKRYMLDGSGILLDPEYIYCQGEQYFFTYYPPCGQEMAEKFHRLTEFFVREVDYRDKKGVHLAYTLHKASMEENYSIEQILEEAFEEEEAEVVRYERYPEDPRETDMQEQMEVAEEKNFWESLRKFWGRSKREKWGSW